MNKLLSKIIFALILLSAGCKSGDSTTEEVVQKARVPVEVTTVSSGSVNDNLELFGTTVYLSRNVVMAPIPSYITQVYIHIGQRVSQGQLLYQLESKERRALGNEPVQYDSSLAGYGRVNVKASAAGIISTIDRQQPGDYVLEGTPLCTIAQSSGVTFQVNVPYEFVRYVKSGNHCIIVLPDESRHQAVFTTPLSTMNVGAQTQSILAVTTDALTLPEGLIAKVLVNKGSQNHMQILPKACVLSDEMMQDFWVMKVINDSTAVKVPIVAGNKNKEEIEIISPSFDANDRILSNGNYGLADTALIKIIEKK